MKRCKAFLPIALATAALLLAAPVHPASGNKPWQVTNLVQDGASVCDGGGAWSYRVSWTPIINENKPWPKYKVAGNGCAGSTYSCTATRCAAVISKCSTRVSASWTGVTADIGKSISGVRVGGIARPPNCK